MRLSSWCKKFIAVGALSCALAATAGAATYSVADSLAPGAAGSSIAAADTVGLLFPWPGLGRTANAGTRVLPFRTIRQANAVVTAGDTVFVYSLSIADSSDAASNKINPAVAGTHALHITYIGRTHQGDYGQHLPIPAILDTMSYVNISGFRVKDDITIQHMAAAWSGNNLYPKATVPKKPTFVVIDSCRAQRVNFFGAESCLVTHNIIDNSGTAITSKNPTVSWLSNDGRDRGDLNCGSGNALDLNPGDCVSCNNYNEFSHNVVDGGHVEVGTNTQKQFFVMRGRSQHNTVANNQFSATFDGTNHDISGRVLYYAYYNTFNDNKWTFESDHPVATYSDEFTDQWSCATVRDSSSYNTFHADTIYAGLKSYNRIGLKLSSTGNLTKGTMVGLTYDACVYRTTGNVLVVDDFISSSITNSVFDANLSPALFFTNAMDNVSILHNTIFTRRLGPAFATGSLEIGKKATIRYNIFYADSVETWADGWAAGSDGCYNGMSHPVVMLTANVGVNDYVSDRNLYFARMANNSVSDKEDMAVSNGNFSSAIRAGSCFSRLYRHDNLSIFGDPEFTDTTWAAFDPRFEVGTLGDSSDFVDYAGAYPPNDPTTLPDSTYALDGAIVQGAKLGAPSTKLLSYVVPDSGAHIVKWVVLITGAGRDTLTQAEFNALTVSSGDSVFVEMDPEFSVPHNHNLYLRGMRTALGTHGEFMIQAQQVDLWNNKSRFSFGKISL